MHIERTFLKSKVGQRTLRLFVFSTLLPIVAVAVLAFSHVSRQLKEQTYHRLHQSSKTTAMTVAERLVRVETALREVASDIVGDPGRLRMHDYHSRRLLRSLAIVTPDGEVTTLMGSAVDVPPLSPGQADHVASGRTAIKTVRGDGGPRVLAYTQALHDSPSILVGEIDPSYLWAELDDRSSGNDSYVCVLDASGGVLFSSGNDGAGVSQWFLEADRSSHTGHFEWKAGGETYVAGYWSVFLKSMYYVPMWTAVLSEPRAEALAPMTDFKRTFPFVVLVSIWFVLSLSIVQIRRSVVPLTRLHEATEKLARGALDVRVNVKSGDEFEKLADAFNSMAAHMEGQFKMLTTISQIDQALLSSLDQRAIVETVLREVPNVFPCEAIMLSLLRDDKPGERTAHIRFGAERFNGVIRLTVADIDTMYENREHFWVRSDTDPPPYLFPLMMQGIGSCVVLPIFFQARASGFVALGFIESDALSGEDLPRARQLVDQVGVALTNASLVNELDRLNVGTLAALSRAIDATSPWTQGHSERVTQMAIRIGKHMGLEKRELAVFHRAGLLHDIGKIAIPQQLLEKPGKLTPEEMRVVQEHVRHGERILEPITAFRAAMPIVAQHHERWDGSGYPRGLAGTQIDLGARIFAVADCFDAISTDRPYRKAMDMDEVLRIIRTGAGSLFDPDVVDAFFEILVEDGYAAATEESHVPES